MTKEEFKAKVSMALGSMERETWEDFLESVWQLHLEASNQWIPVGKELPKEKGAYLFHFDDGQTRVEGYFPELHLSKCVTHWAEIVPPEEED